MEGIEIESQDIVLEVMPVTKFRENASQILNTILRGDKAIVLERYNNAIAVVMPVPKYIEEMLFQNKQSGGNGSNNSEGQ